MGLVADYGAKLRVAGVPNGLHRGSVKQLPAQPDDMGLVRSQGSQHASQVGERLGGLSCQVSGTDDGAGGIQGNLSGHEGQAPRHGVAVTGSNAIRLRDPVDDRNIQEASWHFPGRLRSTARVKSEGGGAVPPKSGWLVRLPLLSTAHVALPRGRGNPRNRQTRSAIPRLSKELMRPPTAGQVFPAYVSPSKPHAWRAPPDARSFC